MLEFQIKDVLPKVLIGMYDEMSVNEDNTRTLFQTFMPRRNEVNRISEFVFDLRTYTSDYFLRFDPSKTFRKYALVEVEDGERCPEDMTVYYFVGGKYAVFYHKGNDNPFPYIYGEWLPASGFVIDERPHFEILSEKYRPGDPESEQEIYIPIKRADETDYNGIVRPDI
ncbi:MAG: GyrI-like domain-containing protein [Bacteroidota bacterium]